MAVNKIEFVDQVPPRVSGQQNGEHAVIAKALQENPGKWARVFKGVKTASIASTINTGGNQFYTPRGSFEATSRQVEKGKFDIYARFIGENGQHKKD